MIISILKATSILTRVNVCGGKLGQAAEDVEVTKLNVFFVLIGVECACVKVMHRRVCE